MVLLPYSTSKRSKADSFDSPDIWRREPQGIAATLSVFAVAVAVSQYASSPNSRAVVNSAVGALALLSAASAASAASD
jgi:hypothetical protein